MKITQRQASRQARERQEDREWRVSEGYAFMVEVQNHVVEPKRLQTALEGMEIGSSSYRNTRSVRRDALDTQERMQPESLEHGLARIQVTPRLSGSVTAAGPLTSHQNNRLPLLETVPAPQQSTSRFVHLPTPPPTSPSTSKPFPFDTAMMERASNVTDEIDLTLATSSATDATDSEADTSLSYSNKHSVGVEKQRSRGEKVLEQSRKGKEKAVESSTNNGEEFDSMHHPITVAPKSKRQKREPTLAELIKARKPTREGKRLSFATVEDYETYLEPATIPANLVFSSCRIILLDYTPKSGCSISMHAMNWIDFVATKGGRLVPASQFVAPSIDLAEDWIRPPAGLASKEERNMLARAKREEWTTHIAILIDARSPSSSNLAPPTFKSVLAQLGAHGISRESLGSFCSIVGTSWLSACGAERFPCAEAAHELFREERCRRISLAEREKLARRRGREPGGTERMARIAEETERSGVEAARRCGDADSADEDEVEVERVQLEHHLMTSFDCLIDGEERLKIRRRDAMRERYQHLVPVVEPEPGVEW